MGVIQEQEQTLLNLMQSVADGKTIELAHQKATEFATLMSYYKCAMLEVETKLNVLNIEYSLNFDRNPINSIKTRLKNPLSIKEKLERRGFPITIESIEQNIYDVAGIRVVCSFQNDVYMLADALLNQDDIELFEKKDYIANPKKNGYRSLHLIVSVPIFLSNEKRSVKVEIQLRTIAMDCWASLEHQLRYKKNIEFSDDMSYELYRCAQLSEDLDQRMDALRRQLLSK